MMQGKSDKPIYVTEPYLPPLDDFIPYLTKIWQSKWLTNNGPFHSEFEGALREYLGVDHLALLSNGTIALVVALQALRVTGEVITTPYSFVASAHALLWNNIEPVFVDIDPRTLTLDPGKIEAAITPRTSAILGVHCYGNPCAVEQIQKIADTYGLKLIYDAAHAFGVEYANKSLLRYGDLSVLSFHATKVFNTFEGGAIICRDAKMKQRIDYLKNFGFADEITIVAPGINGKMNEVQAAFGLLQLLHIEKAIGLRRAVDGRYREALARTKGITCLAEPENIRRNYAYFPIVVEDDYPVSRDALYERLRSAGIFARRYFFPLISNLPMYRGLPSANPENLPIANRIANSILCLPIFPTLARADQELVIRIIQEAA